MNTKKLDAQEKFTKVIYIQIGYLRNKERMLKLVKLGIKREITDFTEIKRIKKNAMNN